MEINPRHPLIKELRYRISQEATDSTTVDLAKVLYETAVLRSGYSLKDSSDFAGRIERMLRLNLGVDLEAPVRVCTNFSKLLKLRFLMQYLLLTLSC